MPSRIPLVCAVYMRAFWLVIAVIVLMGLQVATATQQLHQADERAHASYATVLAHGTLPSIDTPMPDEPERYPRLASMLEGRDSAHREIWVANHPPLYYLLSVPLVWAGDALGQPNVTYVGMRVLNVAGFAATVVLAALVAGELVPRRRAVPVLTAGLALSAGAIPYRAGAIYNDGVATAAASLVLLVALRTVRTGPTRGRLVMLALAGAAAAASRSTGLVAVALACAAVVVAYVLRGRDARSVLRGVLAAVPVGAVPALATAWFYLRNIRLYGDATGSAALFEKFARTPNGSSLGELVSPRFYGMLLRSLWTDEQLHDLFTIVPVLLGLVALTGLVLAVRERRRAGVRLITVSATDVAVWLLTLGYVAVLVVGTAEFIAQGGWIHARYSLPLLPVLGAVFALGALRLGRALQPGVAAEVQERQTVRTALLALLAAGLVAHLSLEVRLDTPVAGVHGVVVIVVGDLVVLAGAWLLVREVLQPSAQSRSRMISTYGPGRANASG